MSYKVVPLLSVCLVASIGCSVGNTPTSSDHREVGITLDDLLSAPVPSLCRHEEGKLVNGILPLQNPREGFVAVAHRSETEDDFFVAFGDLTGRGADDGAVVTSCSAGGVAWPATVQLYTAGPTRLGGVDLGELTHGRELVTELTISGRVLHVRWLTNGPNDAACCPSVKMTADLRWDGTAVRTENMHPVP
ncbi:hypothetical protein [Nocardia salmonicida]|uniref:hypothetical protein n=1 Tax=Nocardia salmonicida TaxID=53431 RepID=UPI0033D77A03